MKKEEKYKHPPKKVKKIKDQMRSVPALFFLSHSTLFFL
jgi:hypothetical protein